MSRCEDFPCCGHELGCCPDFDESGRQLNMKCTCGATVPLDSRYSICEGCLNQEEEGDCDDGDDGWALASAGWGTDEDYGNPEDML